MKSLKLALQFLWIQLVSVIIFHSAEAEKENYWSNILRHLGQDTGGSSKIIRSHCGRNRYDGQQFHFNPVRKRIVGGDASRVAEWPWLVSLQLQANQSKFAKRFPAELPNLDTLDINDYESLAKLADVMDQLKLRLKEISPEDYAEQEMEMLASNRNSDNMDSGVAATPSLDGHICGGALIAPQWILTAKHCFQQIYHPALTASPDKWMAVMGEHHLMEEESHQAQYSIEKIIIHPDFEATDGLDDTQRGLIHHDIALVKLAKPARLNEYVQLACLPYPEERFHANRVCAVAGWGVTENNGNISFVPQHIHVPLVAQDECQAIYDAFNKLFPNIHIEKSMLCAGGEIGKDSCQFDSGGPLVCRSEKDNQWVVTGIVSTGIQCASKYPGIYTRVPYYIKWIRENISNN